MAGRPARYLPPMNETPCSKLFDRGLFAQRRLSDLGSCDNDFPHCTFRVSLFGLGRFSVPACILLQRRAQRQSMLAAGHRLGGAQRH